MFFRGVTWLRDSHGLFDYESRNISKKNMKTQQDGKLWRIANDIELMSPARKDEDVLAAFTQDQAKQIL